jgi:hypothetical protein
MLIVETIAKIRRLFRNEHKSIREISRELRLSRKVVRKALRSDKTAFTYKSASVSRDRSSRAMSPASTSYSPRSTPSLSASA